MLMETAQKANKNGRNIFLISLLLLSYFSFLFLNTYVLELNFTAISVIQEILTIPAMVLTIVMLVFAIRIFINSRYAMKSYAFLSTVLLTAVMIVTWGSFFV